MLRRLVSIKLRTDLHFLNVKCNVYYSLPAPIRNLFRDLCNVRYTVTYIAKLSETVAVLDLQILRRHLNLSTPLFQFYYSDEYDLWETALEYILYCIHSHNYFMYFSGWRVPWLIP